MPPLRLSALPRHLHASKLGREARPSPRMSELRDARHDLGAGRWCRLAKRKLLLANALWIRVLGFRFLGLKKSSEVLDT